jgi:hypothetical protein
LCFQGEVSLTIKAGKDFCIMSDTLIKKLTPEQEALIPVYVQKWTSLALSTESIDRQKAAEAVKAVYAAIEKEEPDVLFFDSPYAVLNAFPISVESVLSDEFWHRMFNREIEIALLSSLYSQLKSQLELEVRIQLDVQVELRQLNEQRRDQLNSQLWNVMYDNLLSQFGELWDEWSELSGERLESHPMHELNGQLYQKLGLLADFSIYPELWAASQGFLFDFCISTLNCTHDSTKWELFQSLTKYCGWILPLEKVAIVCDRPIKLSFDSENRLHAEGEPAIVFADGYTLYSYHGVTLPEKYGELHPTKWQAQWLLEEDNAELRRVLIQEIGYARICQELQAIELDAWQEYTLLKIDDDVDLTDNDDDIEPIYLLKMTCPSTGRIHALRVPPDVNSAREAIRWVNWGTDPEDFAVQT